jgi:hypothetical protein
VTTESASEYTPYFAFSATLRVADLGVAHEEITARLGPPTFAHRRGDPRARPPRRASAAPETPAILRRSYLGERRLAT